jgi:lipid-A-disaccharide synthase-like uncharacterized protein
MTIELGPWHVVLAPWDAVGFVGQSLFFSRFVIQWIASERAGRSYVPTVFWWLSICGGVISLVYSIGIHNPVFTLGQSVGLVPYVRNVVLQRRGGRPRGEIPVQSTK